MASDNRSIHPRNHPGGDRKVSNTCGNSSLGKRLLRAIAGMERHFEQHPQDSACAMRISNAKARLAA
jgi:hypothetical protein